MGKHIIIKEARCSYPKLYGSEVKDGDTFGPGITVILEKGKHDAVKAEIMAEFIEEIKKVKVEVKNRDVWNRTFRPV